MSDELLENYIRQLIEAQQGPEVTIAWQGGEPTLMGLDFFRRAVVYGKKSWQNCSAAIVPPQRSCRSSRLRMPGCGRRLPEQDAMISAPVEVSANLSGVMAGERTKRLHHPLLSLSLELAAP